MLKNIFKKTEKVAVEGTEGAVVETTAEPGKKFDWKKTAVGGLIVTGAVALVGLAVSALSDKNEAEMRVPDTEEPIEVTDEMIEEVVAEE